jgi:hypothetical protein
MLPSLRAAGKRRIAPLKRGKRRKDGAWLHSRNGQSEAQHRRMPLPPPVQRLKSMTVKEYEDFVDINNAGTPECAQGLPGAETRAAPRLLHHGPGDEDAGIEIVNEDADIEIVDERGQTIDVVRVRYGHATAAQAGVELLRSWRDGSGSDTNSRRGRKYARGVCPLAHTTTTSRPRLLTMFACVGSMTMFMEDGHLTKTTQSSGELKRLAKKLHQLLGEAVPTNVGRRKLVVSEDYSPPTHLDPKDEGKCAVVFGEDEPGAATNWYLYVHPSLPQPSLPLWRWCMLMSLCVHIQPAHTRRRRHLPEAWDNGLLGRPCGLSRSDGGARRRWPGASTSATWMRGGGAAGRPSHGQAMWRGAAQRPGRRRLPAARPELGLLRRVCLLELLSAGCTALRKNPVALICAAAVADWVCVW